MSKETKKNYDEIFQAALVLFRSEEAAECSLKDPARGLGNKRPIDMLSSVEDTKVVLDFSCRENKS